MAEEQAVGKVVHYYAKPMVAIIELAAPVKAGDTLHFKGAHDDYTQQIKQMQFEHQDIAEGSVGQQVGVKVDQKVHDNDQVFLVA
ncbi:MAG: hypothetical protein HY545_00910 [Candidatus Doudnabacteria bacterium]|nr:hypothetical protein [Candidatus Doudnabacteria bacterium]